MAVLFLVCLSLTGATLHSAEPPPLLREAPSIGFGYAGQVPIGQAKVFLGSSAGMWSCSAVGIYCPDAESGKVLWKNGHTGYRWLETRLSCRKGG